MSKKIGEVKDCTGATWEVSASLGGVEIAGGSIIGEGWMAQPISPSDASALARLLLDASREALVMKERQKMREAEDDIDVPCSDDHD